MSNNTPSLGWFAFSFALLLAFLALVARLVPWPAVAACWTFFVHWEAHYAVKWGGGLAVAFVLGSLALQLCCLAHSTAVALTHESDDGRRTESVGEALCYSWWFVLLPLAAFTTKWWLDGWLAARVANCLAAEEPGSLRHFLWELLFLALPCLPLYLHICTVLSLLSFLFYGEDKARAYANENADRTVMRIPERTLHLFEFLGGWPGALVAQRMLRHKSSKSSYQVAFWTGVLFFETCKLVILLPLLGTVWQPLPRNQPTPDGHEQRSSQQENLR